MKLEGYRSAKPILAESSPIPELRKTCLSLALASFSRVILEADGHLELDGHRDGHEPAIVA